VSGANSYKRRIIIFSWPVSNINALICCHPSNKQANKKTTIIKNAKHFSPFNAGHFSELSVLQLKDKIAWKTGGEEVWTNNKILLFDKN